MPSIPTWKIEVAFDANIIGVFRIGVSTIGGADTLGGPFSESAFTDITSDVLSLSIARGRNTDLTQLTTGECTVALKDRTGKYNPENASSPYTGKLNPMRPLRVKVTHPVTAQTATIFYGYLNMIEHDPSPEVRQSRLHAIDLLDWLDNAFPTVASASSIDFGTAIQKVLEAVDFTDRSKHSLDAGRVLATFSTDATKTARAYIEDLVTADQGEFFMSGAGVATFKAWDTLWKKQAAVATFDQSLIGEVRPSSQLRNLINKQTVTRSGGVAQTAQDTTSQKSYAVRQGSGITTSYLTADADALQIAQWIVARRASPQRPAHSMLVSNKSDALLTQQLTRELAHYVTVSETLGGSSFSGHIVGVEHEVDMGGRQWRTKYMVARKPKHAFTIGQSVIGGTDVIGF